MRNRVIVVTVVLTIGLIGAVMTQGQDAPKATPPNVFASRVVQIDAGEGGAVLENPRLQTLGDKTFIVGTAVDTGTPEEWRGGLVVWIAMTNVVQVVEFQSVEQFRQRVEQYDKRTKVEGAPASRAERKGRL